MGVEVELKARIDDFSIMRHRLDNLAPCEREYHKIDRYFGPSDRLDEARCRIRHDNGEWICTYKEKTIEGGIEENNETEFRVSDGEALARFVGALGLHQVISKRKTGRAYRVDGVLVELSEVESAGTFVELELILEEDSPRIEVIRARRRLLSLLTRLGIDRSMIEPRPYNHIIDETLSKRRALPGDPL